LRPFCHTVNPLFNPVSDVRNHLHRNPLILAALSSY
jgi:hypothetical protein